MYLHDDVVVLLGLNQVDDRTNYNYWEPANFTIEVWNVADRGAPHRVRRVEVTSSYVDARLVNGVAYIVLYGW